MISAHFGQMAQLGEIDLQNHIKTLGYSNIPALGREKSVFRSFPHFYVKSPKSQIPAKNLQISEI